MFRRKLKINTVKICFEEFLEESHCRIDAMCIWQGVAKGRFLVSINGENHRVDLATLDLFPKYRRDTVLFGYKIKLATINPYLGTSEGTKKAELEITPQ